MLLIGVDTGGTFTDFLWKDGDRWGTHKRLSTPDDPARAVLEGVRQIAHDRAFDLVHGSTVATNAILERRGARTALVTNRRFEDVLEIARQNRAALYDFHRRKNPPLVPRQLRFGISGRIDHGGTVVEDLAPGDVADLVESVGEAGVESIAVCCLFAFANPSHERAIGEALAPLGIPVSLSHETLAEFREYERTSTTVINAYVSPKMRGYVATLSESLGGSSFRIMQSSGGSISAATAMRESVRTILSGPAGGAVGALEVGRAAGHTRLISFDMGGTSTDVALLDGALPLTVESTIAGYPVKVPMIDIHTVGAGGGSIASIDAGGALKVGPESAGARPGPICYGQGTEITVTDANLLLGRLIPDHFLGGEMRLDADRVLPHFQRLAQPLDLTPIELAEGILEVANTTMQRALKVISVERGFDPREFTLFSFGGAGGMHAAYLAREMNISRVLVPAHPGILSAAGMLMADVVKDYSQTVMLRDEDVDLDALDDRFREMESRGTEELIEEGVAADRVAHQRFLDMRYQGQSYELLVPMGADYRERFHALHEKTYGYAHRDGAIEVVNVRLRSLGLPDKPTLPTTPRRGETPDAEALLDTRPVVFDGREYATRIFDRARLAHGNCIDGPAVLVEYSSTIVVPPWTAVRVDAFGNLLLDLADGASTR